MAEDIDIIGLWEKGKQYAPNVEIDVDETIKSKSRGTLYWIRVILTIEFWINVTAMPCFFYLLFIQHQDYIWGSTAVVITAIYLFYYRFLIRQVKQFSYEDDVRTSLKKLYGYLHFFVLHYKVVLWVSLLIGLIKGFVEDVPNSVTPEQMAEPMFWPMMIGVSAIMAGAVGLVLTLLVNLLYGRKIKRLRKIVNEFSTEEHQR